LLNVIIFTGLCGVYDLDNENDFLSGDEVTMDTQVGTKWRGRIVNNAFVNSWRYMIVNYKFISI